MKTNQLRGGFTLIELLTVIAIIGILAAILIPTVSRVRDQARFSRGQSNMREWTRAMLLFAQDNRGWFPHDGGGSVSATLNKRFNGIDCWWNELPPMLGQKSLKALSEMDPSPQSKNLPTFGDNSIFICPAAQRQTGSQAPAWLCYGPPFGQSDPTANSGFLTNFNKIQLPSRTVIFAELTNHAPGQTGAFANANPKYLATGNRWNGKALLGFADGSVRSYNSRQLTEQGQNTTTLKGENSAGVIWQL